MTETRNTHILSGAGHPHAPPTEAADEVVAFSVSGQDFCIDIMAVREIRGWTETTILPHAQSYVKGVINLRGAVVPVVDLSDRLGLGTVSPGARHVIIITQIGQRIVGLLADVVTDILALDPASVQPVPEIAAETARAFISGVASVEGRMLRRIDLTRILPQAEARAA
ncbi:MAG: chemotaxis protein CheW [Rhodobacteraceae bacterium]|nr:chemotaxis protein CheW [Paracoccaceae bacterium]